MGAVLAWFSRFFLVTTLTEVFKRATIFLTFNIILAFALNYITNHSFNVSIFSLGAAVSGMLAGLPPFVVYVMAQLQIAQALFVILNAYLARFAYRLVFKSMGAA
ncbi:hypothetical protein [Sphingomonas sp.]|uniref:hypothetical protein n=1 Tax=Sphingomonas sp. TaxID=28214 RepID=UPI003D6DA845